MAAAASSSCGLSEGLGVCRWSSRTDRQQYDTTRCNARRCDANDRRTSVDVDQGGAAGGGQRGGVLAGVSEGVGGSR